MTQGTARWDIGELASGASVVLELDVRLSALGVQVNRAQIALVGPTGPAVAANGDVESRLDNNVATAAVRVDAAPARPLPASGFTGWVIVRSSVVTLVAGLLLGSSPGAAEPIGQAESSALSAVVEVRPARWH